MHCLGYYNVKTFWKFMMNYCCLKLQSNIRNEQCWRFFMRLCRKLWSLYYVHLLGLLYDLFILSNLISSPLVGNNARCLYLRETDCTRFLKPFHALYVFRQIVVNNMVVRGAVIVLIFTELVARGTVDGTRLVFILPVQCALLCMQWNHWFCMLRM